jgi:hypothetical protein
MFSQMAPVAIKVRGQRLFSPRDKGVGYILAEHSDILI